MGTGLDSVPNFLIMQYAMLSTYIKDGNVKEAKTYLYNLPPYIYDSIIERSGRGYAFETIVNKIEELTTVKKTNDLYKINNYEGDDNFIF